MKHSLEESEALESNFSDALSPNRSDSVRSALVGENSTITLSQLAHELKKQKQTLISEFAEIMSNSVGETKEMTRTSEQNSSAQGFHPSFPSSVLNASLKSRLSSASAPAPTHAA